MHWSKVGKELYNDTLSAYFSTTYPTSDPEAAVQYITKAHQTTAEVAVTTSDIKV